MRINIIGGGPAGLYFALLMKKARPDSDITLFERDAPTDTFGWGIVFSDKTLSYLRDADGPTHAAITAAFEHWDNVDVVHRDEKVTIRGNRFSGIARLKFLNIFQDRCRELGVRMNFRTAIGEADVDALAACDLLVGADGANSTVRRRYAAQFGPSVDVRRNKYIWLGTPHLFRGLTLTFRQNDAGTFAAHSYKFNQSASTFIVECDEATWSRAGLAGMDEPRTCAYLAEVFARDLEGAPLLANNFVRWLNFPLIRNQRWQVSSQQSAVSGQQSALSTQAVVLLGDALHTAHFSIGSGTKLALEDAIALFKCMQAARDVPAALAKFERVRRPVVEALQDAAWSSLLWFENMQDRMHLAPMALAYELMTRSGRIDHEELRKRDPLFVAAYEAWRSQNAAEQLPN